MNSMNNRLETSVPNMEGMFATMGEERANSSHSESDSTKAEEIKKLMGSTPYNNNLSPTDNVIQAIRNRSFPTETEVVLKGLHFSLPVAEVLVIPNNIVLIDCIVTSGKVSCYRGNLTASYNGPPTSNKDIAIAEVLGTESKPIAKGNGAQAFTALASTTDISETHVVDARLKNLARLTLTTPMSTVANAAAEEPRGIRSSIGEEDRSNLCRIGHLLHTGGPRLKQVAQKALAGSNAYRQRVIQNIEWKSGPLGEAFWLDGKDVVFYRDARWQRVIDWRKQLEPYDIYDSPPEFDADIATFMFDRQSQTEYSFNENLGPRSSQATLERATTIVEEKKNSDQAIFFFGPLLIENKFADEIRLFLQYGGFATVAPSKDSASFRIEVEALKTRWASCDSSNPTDPNAVLRDVVATASEEWQAELDAQAQQRAEIVSSEIQTAQDVCTATEAMIEALGQTWVAEKILDKQKYWQQGWVQSLKEGEWPRPTRELVIRSNKDLVAIQAQVNQQLMRAKQAVVSSQAAIDKVKAAQMKATQIAIEMGTPQGRGLAYAQQSAQVSKASAAATQAAAQAIETALRAIQATTADSTALFALAKTQSHAVRSEFLRVATEESANQAQATALAAKAQAEQAHEAEILANKARNRAELAERTAATAKKRASQYRVIAEQERANAAAARSIAENERAKASQAESRALAQQSMAELARLNAESAMHIALEKESDAVLAETKAAVARSATVLAERNKNVTSARAQALLAIAAAAEGSTAASEARDAANQSEAAAGQADYAAQEAHNAAIQAEAAAVAARAAATEAKAAATRSRSAAINANADAEVSRSEALIAHASAVEAIEAATQAANNAKNAQELAEKAMVEVKQAKTHASEARIQAEQAIVESALAAGQAFAAGQAAIAAYDAAAAVMDPANKAVGLGAPFIVNDTSAGMAVLVGQNAKTLAQQQEAAAQAKAAEANHAAQTAKIAAEEASKDAKVAAQAAANAASYAAQATQSVVDARLSAIRAENDAAATQKADLNTAELSNQAQLEAMKAEVSAREADVDASFARNAALDSEKDAHAARKAAIHAKASADAARNAAADAEAAAIAAEVAALTALVDAQQAQQAAARTEEQVRKEQASRRASDSEKGIGGCDQACISGLDALVAGTTGLEQELAIQLRLYILNLGGNRYDYIPGAMVSSGVAAASDELKGLSPQFTWQQLLGMWISGPGYNIAFNAGSELTQKIAVNQHNIQLLANLRKRIVSGDFRSLNELGGTHGYDDGVGFKQKIVAFRKDMLGMISDGKAGNQTPEAFLGGYLEVYQVINVSPEDRTFTVGFAAYNNTGMASLLHKSLWSKGLLTVGLAPYNNPAKASLLQKYLLSKAPFKDGDAPNGISGASVHQEYYWTMTVGY